MNPLNPMNESHRRFLQMALVGYEQEKRKIEEAIAELRSQLPPPTELEDAMSRRKSRRTMSPAAKRRISAAQRKRWEAYRQSKSQPKSQTAISRKRQ